MNGPNRNNKPAKLKTILILDGDVLVRMIRLSQAVAASSAFPPVLSPFLLKLPAGSFIDWPSGTGTHLFHPQYARLLRDSDALPP
jgi:hypothetical protein